MKEHFSIGETARLNNISIQTLRYYDKLGIFKPDFIDSNNGYRYYHLRQFFYLDIIKYLKGIQTPLEEIKTTLLNRPREMRTFLENQEAVIQEEFKRLESAKELLYKRKRQLNEQLEICSKDKGVIYFRERSGEHVLKVPTPSLKSSDDPGLNARKLAAILEEKGYIIDNHYGYTYRLKEYENNVIEYSYMYTSVEKNETFNINDPIEQDYIQEGKFVCIAFDWTSTEKNYMKYYNRLKSYVEDNHLSTEEIVYELSLPKNYSSLKKETFLTELRLLILE